MDERRFSSIREGQFYLPFSVVWNLLGSTKSLIAKLFKLFKRKMILGEPKMVSISWKKVATGVLAASIGAAAFGAIHYMFLAPAVGGTPDVMGVPISVILPFIVGTLGFIGAFALSEKHKMAREVVTYGSAALIGAGVMSYAGWITTGTHLAARPAAARFIPTRAAAPLPSFPSAMNAGGTKII